MKKNNYLMLIIVLLSLCFSTGTASAQEVIFETQFQSVEGWTKQGSVDVSDRVDVTVPYKGKSFTFSYVRCIIEPEKGAVGECQKGSLEIRKNEVKYPDITPSTNSNAGYFELPVFEQDIQISFYRSSTTKGDRVVAIEYSNDGGRSWMCTEDCVAPLLNSPSDICGEFVCPVKFEAGIKTRLVVISKGGNSKVLSLKITKFKPDDIPPSVVSMEPAHESVEISPSIRNVSILFDEPIKAGGEGNIYVSDEEGSSYFMLTSDGLTYNKKEAIIPFSSDFHLQANTLYYVLLEAGAIRDLANNANPELIEKSFTTKVNASSENDIVSFKVDKQIGDEVIDPVAATVQLLVNYDVNLENDLSPKIGLSEYALIDEGYKDFSKGPATYTVTAEDGSKKVWTVTIVKKARTQAELPSVYLGSAENTWRNNIADGWKTELGSADNVLKMNDITFYTATVGQAQYYVENYFKPGANRISFRIRYGNNTSNYKVSLKESQDGSAWTEVAVFSPSISDVSSTNPDPAPVIPVSSTTLGLRSYPLKSTSQYVRWVYELRSSTSYYLDDVVIEKAPEDTTPPELPSDQPDRWVNYSNGTKGQIYLLFSEPVKVSDKLIAQTTSIKLNGEDIYEANLLSLRNGHLILHDVKPLTEGAECTIEIPADALVDLAGNPFAGKKITFSATSSMDGFQIADELSMYVSEGTVFLSESVDKIELFNQLGLRIKVEADTDRIEVGSLKGMYIVRCTLQHGGVKTVKILL